MGQNKKQQPFFFFKPICTLVPDSFLFFNSKPLPIVFPIERKTLSLPVLGYIWAGSHATQGYIWLLNSGQYLLSTCHIPVIMLCARDTYIPSQSAYSILVETLPDELERPQPQGLDPAGPKGITKLSRSCPEKDFKDRHTAQHMSNTSGKVY